MTHDGRTIRYPDPEVKANDTIRVDLSTGKILDFAKFEPGNVVISLPMGNGIKLNIVEDRNARMHKK